MENAYSQVEHSLTRHKVYLLLSTGFSYPLSRFYQLMVNNQYFQELSENLKLLKIAQVEFQTDLIHSCSLEKLQEEHVQLFNLNSTCPPYETEYTSPHVFSKTQSLADIGGFYKAFGLELGSGQKERVDFIGTELEFMGYLCFKTAYALKGENHTNYEICWEAQKKFFQEHLARWIKIFCEKLLTSTENLFYKDLSQVLLSFFDFEVQFLNLQVEDAEAPPFLDTSEPSTQGLGCDSCF